MEGKPMHYDGSIQNSQNPNENVESQPFVLTDEMRVNISGNPYSSEK
ncbi:hypothetical protein SM124_06745 [Bacillus sp. 31A1R]|uniref:Uncharacterized protein n=1 Tax=Robertmurraya mangrovi TaxID=3098077 RepID=A0ABU5IWC9_9BACI|nr:hypothetical protein [Bacillus sp. 31A1R]MDZ5471442.1 hypothetical protein [Bacillus sp. 31A1R]